MCVGVVCVSGVSEEKESTTLNADHVAQRLVKEMGFSEDQAVKAAGGEVGSALLALIDADKLHISTADPLLVLVIDPNNPLSADYANAGNYGLPAGSPGAIPWPGGAAPAPGAPLPAGVAMAPPRALSNFIANAPGVQDLSPGSGLFHIPNLEMLHNLPGLLQSQPQFERIGPRNAARLGIPVQPPLVSFLTFDRIGGPANLYRNFEQSA